MEQYELGYFGNIWVRQNVLPHPGDVFPGHKHKFDHVSLLVSGELKVKVVGYPPKTFKAPTFIVIRKEHEHEFTALQPNTLFYCVFALRDIEGEVFDPIYSTACDPLSASAISGLDGLKLKNLLDRTHEVT